MNIAPLGSDVPEVDLQPDAKDSLPGLARRSFMVRLGAGAAVSCIAGGEVLLGQNAPVGDVSEPDAIEPNPTKANVADLATQVVGTEERTVIWSLIRGNQGIANLVSNGRFDSLASAGALKSMFTSELPPQTFNVARCLVDNKPTATHACFDCESLAIKACSRGDGINDGMHMTGAVRIFQKTEDSQTGIVRYRLQAIAAPRGAFAFGYIGSA